MTEGLNVRAVVITKPGDLDALEVADRPVREPAAGDPAAGQLERDPERFETSDEGTRTN
jgi:hypothetical protein